MWCGKTPADAGALTGTRLYISPEGIEKPDEVDARSDLYAVGAVGYFLLTGKALFDTASIAQICMQQVHQMPASPSERLGRTLDEDLEQVVMRCLAKNPAERFQNARELEGALAGCGSQVSWTMDDAKKWWREFKPQEASKPDDTPPHGIDGTLVIELEKQH